MNRQNQGGGQQRDTKHDQSGSSQHYQGFGQSGQKRGDEKSSQGGSAGQQGSGQYGSDKDRGSSHSTGTG